LQENKLDKFLEVIRSLSESAKAENRKPKQTYDFLMMLPDVDEDMSELQPFIFTSLNLPIADIPKANDDILACPFELFSIELEDIALTCTEVTDSKDNGINIQAIICKELSPSVYKFWMYNKVIFEDGSEERVVVKVEEGGNLLNGKKFDGKAFYETCMDLVSNYIMRLHDEKLGIFDANGRAKIKVNEKKLIYKPKGAIYVTPKVSKKEKEELKAQGTKKINWDHVWTVMSHWRKLNNPESLGLSRLGERKVKGYTYIGAYKKGEGKEIKKVRRVN
jgi:hypothetical protein